MHNMYLHVVADLVVMCVWMNAVEDFFFTFFFFFFVLVFFFLCYSTTNCPALDLLSVENCRIPTDVLVSFFLPIEGAVLSYLST